MNIAFYGSSLLSSYWNGAATYYRGLLRDLARRGYQTTFYEPDAFERQQHRDIDPPDWARVVVYPATEEAVRGVIAEAAPRPMWWSRPAASACSTTCCWKASCGGPAGCDQDLLGRRRARHAGGTAPAAGPSDAPGAAGARPRVHLWRRAARGGSLRGFGARRCVPIYNALDPTTHHPAPADARFAADLSFLGNRLPDREARVEQFFLDAAARLPDRRFLIGGNGWDSKPMPPNVRHIGHVYTHEHNSFNTTPLAVLNIARDSMAAVGYSPATRVFEAAGAGACLITDSWLGLDLS